MIAVGVTSIVLLAVIAIAAVVHYLRRWPEPIVRPFECFPCRARFVSAQHLVWHQAQHRADFDHASVEVLRGYRIAVAPVPEES